MGLPLCTVERIAALLHTTDAGQEAGASEQADLSDDVDDGER